MTVIRMQPAHHAGVRRNNLSLVLRRLHGGGMQSRASVAAVTGLNKATVSSLVADLIERGLVGEVGTNDEGRIGRPATLLELDGRGVAALGVDLNVDFLTVVATDLAGRTIFHRTRALDAASRPVKKTLDTVISIARKAHEQMLRQTTTIAGVTVAVPGLVSANARMVAFAPNLDWHDVDIGDRLAEALGGDLEVTIDNDANLAALAEYRVGEFAGVANLIYLTGQAGVGGGLIMDGRPVRGSGGFSGEVGHMHVMSDGPVCGCGRRGCWEALVGLKQLVRDALPDAAADLEASPNRGPEAKIAAVVARARAGDPVTLEALERHAHWLGIGLSILVNVLNPEVIILGGFFREIQSWVLPSAERTMREYVVAPDAGGARLAISTLGFSAAALGASIHAAERVFDDPTLVPPISA